MNKLSDFSKQQVLDCYEMMVKFVSFKEKIKSADLYRLEEKISRRRIGIPKEVYDKIISFVEVNFTPMIDGKDFNWCYDADCGAWDYNGDNFFHHDYDEFRNYDERMLQVYYDRIRLVEDFGMRELYPLLTDDTPVAIGEDNSVFVTRKWVSRGIKPMNRKKGH